MSDKTISDALLLAFLDDALPENQMAEIEQRLRSDQALANHLEKLIEAHDQGAHSIGEIWRRHRLSCPTREELGSYLLQALPELQTRSIELHLNEIGCRFCQSSLDDLIRIHQGQASDSTRRREKYFQSSVGRLPRKT